MHTYIGDRIFDDRLSLSPAPDGKLQGTVSVPGGFTAPVEHLEAVDSTHFSFEINPTEGNGQFRVAYHGEFAPKDEVFIGFATLPDAQDQLIGGFVAQRSQGA